MLSINPLKIEINRQLFFEILDKSGTQTGEKFKSDYLKIISDTEAKIKAPNNQYRLAFIPLGAKIKVSFNHDKYGEVCLLGSIESKQKKSDLTELQIKIENDFLYSDEQKRRFIRIDHYIKSEYFLYLGKEAPDDDYIKSGSALIRNLSSLGACILTDEKIKTGSLMDLYIWISQERVVKMRCKVIRSTEYQDDDEKGYESGLELLKITDRDKDLLKEFITKNVIYY